METQHVLGNTWVFKSWELIPFYKVDEHHCILLDTGLNDQREELEEALQREGLTPVGVICSHAHIDHMGNVAYLKEKYGTKLAMSLGEAGHQMSYLGLNITNYLMSPEDVVASRPSTAPPVWPTGSSCPPRTASPSAGRPLTSSTPPATPWTTSAPAPRTTSSIWGTP